MIGRRVKVVRQAQGFTAEQLAAQLGDNFSVNTLRQLEVGARRWNADNLEAVAHALGVDPRALLPGPPEADTGAPRAIPNPAPAPPLRPAERALLDAARAGDGAAAVVALARFFITQPDGKDRT